MERFDELANDMDRWKRDADAAHATIDRGPLGYAPDPAAQKKAILDERISSLLLDMIAARKLAQSIGDPRAVRLVTALNAMPGDNS